MHPLKITPMVIEQLELKLRTDGRYSEEQIQQIVSFIFTLENRLPSVSDCEIKRYFKKFLVFTTIEAYKTIAEKNPPPDYEKVLVAALDKLSLMLVDKKFTRNEFLDEAETVIIHLLIN